MVELTFGEQVKIVLNRKGMTIKELAELIEERTGKKMSRQNLTQRLSRDNFQEHDMRMIAGILECPLYLSILEDEAPDTQMPRKTVKAAETIEEKVPVREKGMFAREEERERDITVGELLDIHKRLDEIEESVQGAAAGMNGEPVQPSYTVEELLAEVDALESETQENSRTSFREEKPRSWKSYLQINKREEEAEPETYESEAYDGYREAYETSDAEIFGSDYEADEELYIAGEADFDEEEDTEAGDVNPYTGREYKTNSVRMHPDRIGYVQVYDRAEHKWTDMTEWAFLGYQERKKALLGKDYVSPIYLD